MKLVFAHDHIFKINNGRVYSSGGITSEVLSRYLKHAESVTVISRQQEVSDSAASQLTEITSPLTEFLAIPNVRSLKGLARLPAAVRKIWSIIRARDAVVARLPSSIGQIAAEVALLTRRRLVVEVVGCAWDASKTHGSILGKMVAPFAYLRMRLLVRLAPNVVYITKEFLQKRYPSSSLANVAICANVSLPPIDENLVLKQRLAKVERLYSQKRECKRPILGLLGSLDVSYKGHEFLIRALARLSASFPGLRVQFVGPGDSNRWLRLSEEQGVSGSCEFLGPISSGKPLFSWIDQIDLLVQPSLAEGQGRIIIEAMSRACPVVASRVGGIVELLDEGALVAPANPEELADRIEAFLAEELVMKFHVFRNLRESLHFRTSNIESVRTAFLSYSLSSERADGH